MSDPEVLEVLHDCVAWTTTIKKGALVSDANAKPVNLPAKRRVTVIGVALDVAPRSLFVTRRVGPTDTLEIREHFLRPR